MDGTDEGSEGNWRFTSTDEQPFITDSVGRDVHRNCLQIISSNSLGSVPCDFVEDRSMFCESESNYSFLYFSSNLSIFISISFNFQAFWVAGKARDPGLHVGCIDIFCCTVNCEA